MKIHHIGYLVKNVEKAQKGFEALGYKEIQPVMYDEYRKINISFIEKEGYVVELVAPAAKDSVVSALYKRYKNCPYHICYTSSDFEADIANLCSNGYVQIDAPQPAPAINGKRVVFLMNASLGMIEIVEG